MRNKKTMADMPPGDELPPLVPIPEPDAPRKHPGGRPSLYRPEYAKQAEKLCKLGATDPELADFFGVHLATIYRWRHEHEEFCDASRVGKEFADARVEKSLYQRAVGYEQDEVKIFLRKDDEEPVYAPYRAKIAPDTTAAIFWLKNRKPTVWRDRQEVDHQSSDGSMIPQRIEIVPVDAASTDGKD